jgi:hypothetical protein
LVQRTHDTHEAPDRWKQILRGILYKTGMKSSCSYYAPAFTLVSLLCLFFDPEDGGDMPLQRTAWRYIPEDRTLQSFILNFENQN